MSTRTPPELIDFEREDGPTLSTTDVCYLTGLTPNTVREMLVAGEIVGVQLGRNWKIPWRNLRQYLYHAGFLPLPAVKRWPAHEPDRRAH